MVAIMLIAIVLRLAFFVGLVGGDPQDDGVYYGNALTLYNNGPHYLRQYRDLPADFIPNPIDQFNVRPMVTFPIAASFAVFGPGEFPAVLWSLFCSLVSVFVAYRLGRLLHGPTVGHLAALLCAFYPLEVINGTRILSDAPVGMFCAISLWLLLEGTERHRPMLAVTAGMAGAGAYLANGRGLLMVTTLTVCAIFIAARRDGGWRTPLLYIAGFAVVFSIEALAYLWATGDPLLNYHIHDGASRFKYLNEPVSSLSWGWLTIQYTNGVPFEITRTVLLLNQRATNQFGLFFYLFAVSVLFSLVRGVNRLLIVIVVALFVYLDFGPVRLSVDWAQPQLIYMMVFKQERFLLMLTAPFLVLAAYFLHAVALRSRPIAAVVVALLVVSSLAAIARTRHYYRAGLDDLRTLAVGVGDNPHQLFVGDYWAILHLRIFLGHRPTNLAVLTPQTTVEQLQHACVILGGSRGVELNADYVETTLPAFAREILRSGVAPAGWLLVREVAGERSAQRLHNVKLYCVT
jgi:4-amino-4-deoxy-L-arabinose transferase-like glycosyltransferase